MNDEKRSSERTCKIEADLISRSREALPAKADKIIESCDDNECFTHIDYKPIPSKSSIIEIIVVGFCSKDMNVKMDQSWLLDSLGH